MTLLQVSNMLTMLPLPRGPDFIGTFILAAPAASLDPVKDPNDDHNDTPTVLAPIDDAPATSSGVLNRFFFAGSFNPDDPYDVPIATTFVHPGHHSRVNFLF